MRNSNLDKVSDEDILFPRPVFFWREIWPDDILPETPEDEDTLSPVKKPFKIFPAPDSLLKDLTSEIAQIISVLDGIARWSAPKEDRPGFNLVALTPAIPQILEIILPSASKIISTCLRGVTADEVSNDWYQDEKIDALIAIFKANRIDLLLKKIQTMSKDFLPVIETPKEVLEEAASPMINTSSLQESRPETFQNYQSPLKEEQPQPIRVPVLRRGVRTIKSEEEDGSTPSS